MHRLRGAVTTKMVVMLVLGLLLARGAWAQTNPTAQSLPYTQDFSGLAHTSTTYPAGWQGWMLAGSSSTSFRTNAPTADEALLASSSASITTGGVHNYNGKIGILASGSTDPALVLVINTTGHSNITVAFDMMTIRNPYNGTTNTRINQVDLQYRVGTSGVFTSVSGSASGIYESNTTAQTASGVTTPQKLEAKSFTLPSACDNQATVQLRWVQRDASGSGSRPSFAVDNISVCPGVGAAGTITGASSACANAAGVSYSISAVSGATTYTWTVPSGASVASGQGTISITVNWGSTSGNITVTPSNSCNTGTANSLAVTVNPAVTANAGTDATTCVGETITLNGTPGGGDGTYTFTWTVQAGSPDLSGLQFSSTSAEDPTFTPTTTGTYTLRFTVDDGVCPAVFDDVVITVNPAVTANAGTDATTCVGETITLNGTPGGGDGTYTFKWAVQAGSPDLSGTQFSSTTAEDPTFKPTTAGTYTLRFTADDGICPSKFDEVTITVNPLPTVTFTPVGPFLVTDAAVDLSPSVSPSGGAFTGAGISGTMFDPATAGVGEHSITYSFTDGNNCTKSVIEKIKVNPAAPPPSAKAFVLLAEEDIQINGQVNSDGDMHANNDIFFNQGNKPNSVHTGNVTASDDIFIKKNNKIVGTVQGDEVENSGTVTGGVTENAGIATVPLPILAKINNGDDDITVKKGKTLMLDPGDYAEVKVDKKGTLKLASGTYNLECLNLGEKAMLVIDLTAGLPITINVDEEVRFGKNAMMKLMPSTASTDLITIKTDEDDDSDADFDDDEDDDDRIVIGEGARVFGNIIAPETMVVLDKKSRFKGAICAENVLALNGARFVHHSSTATFPKESEVDESEVAEFEVSDQSPVTSYQLEQNYPNPFSPPERGFAGNPSTEIAFALPEAGKVTLNIYALTGQLVATLVDGEMAAGRHQLRWNGRNQSGQLVAAGIYLYHLIVTGDDGSAVFTQTRRMTLLR